MATRPPTIGPELVEFLESGVSILVGTRDGALRPACARAMGATVDPAQGFITIYLPEAPCARTLANLRDNAQVAVTFSRPLSHRSIQVKGVSTAMRRSTESDRAIQERYRAAYFEQLQSVGLPRAVSVRMVFWPSITAVIRVVDLFEQTPGPGAGRRLEGPTT